MFGLIRRWWQARRFRSERELFEFYTGHGWRRVDPWRTWRTFTSDPEYNFETMAELAAAEQEPELTYALNAICRSFGLSRYSPECETGLTDDELLGVFNQFMEYLTKLKKKQGRGQTLSAFTAGESPPSAVAPDSTTNSPSHSPCSPNEPEPAQAASSPTV